MVDFDHGGGIGNAMFFKWAYTAITRAAKNLVVIRPPEFDEIDSDMWEGAPQPQPGEVGSETQEISADPD